MILVTGATGTIGSATVNALKARGARFKVAARSPDRLAGQGVETVPFDWDKPQTFGPALGGVEKLFLLTPNTTDQQARYVQALVDASKKAGVKHIVRLSVMGANAEPGILLGRMHRESEKLIEGSGLAWTMLRPTFFMDNFLNYYGVDPRKDCTLHLAHGQGKAVWVDGRDVGEVAAAALTSTGHEGKAYELTGPQALGAAEACAILTEVLGHKYTYVELPAEQARKAMEDSQTPAWMVQGFSELSALIRNGQSATPASGVKDALGRPPRGFRDFAKDLAAGNR